MCRKSKKPTVIAMKQRKLLQMIERKSIIETYSLTICRDMNKSRLSEMTIIFLFSGSIDMLSSLNRVRASATWR